MVDIYVLIVTISESGRQDKIYWIELLQALPEYYLPLISMSVKFWFVSENTEKKYWDW
jgi:hypothetical protein